MVETKEATVDQYLLVAIGLFLLLAAALAAARIGFYSMPKGEQRQAPPLFFREVLGVFAAFLTVQVVIVPVVTFLWLSYSAGEWVNPMKELTFKEEGWVSVAAIISSALGVLFFCYYLEPRTPPIVAGPNGLKSLRQGLHDFLFGCFSWFLSFPWVFVVSQMLAVIVKIVFNPPEVDQVAVKHLKMTLSDPPLFTVTLLTVVTFVPLVEELIFRGFLQTWLRQFMSMGKAIAIASAVFALFHFSLSQGWHNIEFLASLFLLSCFLGYVYERQGSIWAPIGLHAAFNLISILLIVWGVQ